MRELTGVVALLTETSCMKELARIVGEVVRVSALGTTVAVSCKEEFADLLRNEGL